MPVTVLVVSLVLLMFGLGSFVMGLSLTPTDMARAWLVFGGTLFSGGMISLAIGFAVQALIQSLARAGAPAAASGDEMPRPPEVTSTAGSEPGATPEAVARSGISTSGMAAAGGVVLGAGAAALSAQRAAAPADDFERDLFAPQPEASATAAQEAHGPAPSELDLPELDLRLSPAPAPCAARTTRTVPCAALRAWPAAGHASSRCASRCPCAAGPRPARR